MQTPASKNPNELNAGLRRKLHYYKIAIAAVFFAAAGIVLMIFAAFSNQDHPGNLPAFLALNGGALLIIGGLYGFVSELFLKRDFANQLQASIDSKLQNMVLHESLLNMGLESVDQTFEESKLVRRLLAAQNTLIVAMRSGRLFRQHYDEIRGHIETDNAKLDIVLLDPSSNVVQCVSPKFSDHDEDKLRRSSADAINVFLKREIYDKLTSGRRENLNLFFSGEIPVYSAYVFDDEELWYIPYHFRRDYRPIPVFIG